MIEISGREISGLFIVLKSQEENLDKTQSAVLGKLEKFLYGKLSVMEIEEIELLYSKMDPVLNFGEI